ncbi:MAG: TIGR02270 family protein [Pseudomonadota bacterium]|nr:TIGR02270 family protein [Pseudomonadota bacterium]
MSILVINIIVQQHAEEAAFLWLLRDAAVRAPHYSLKDLARLDGRVEAHLDGLRVAGEAGWEICAQQLAHEEPGEVFAATVLAFESGDNGRTRSAVEAGCRSGDAFRGLISGLGWIAWPQLDLWMQRLLGSAVPAYRRIAIAASAIHRRDPGPALAAAVNDADALLRARALRAAGELKRHDLLAGLRRHLQDDDPGCRFWAAWAAALLNDPQGIAALQPWVETASPFRERALQLVLRAMDSRAALGWIGAFAGAPGLARIGVLGTGIIGDPAGVPWLIRQLERPELARLAGEAFTLITGVDLADQDMEGEWPEGFAAGPGENPQDPDVAMDADEDLPWPDPARVAAWWDRHQGGFQPGTRYFLGQPIDIPHLHRVLVHGRQRQRRAAALELALREPEVPLFETRAPGFLQQRRLA